MKTPSDIIQLKILLRWFYLLRIKYFQIIFNYIFSRRIDVLKKLYKKENLGFILNVHYFYYLFNIVFMFLLIRILWRIPRNRFSFGITKQK